MEGLVEGFVEGLVEGLVTDPWKDSWKDLILLGQVEVLQGVVIGARAQQQTPRAHLPLSTAKDRQRLDAFQPTSTARRHGGGRAKPFR